MAGFLKQGAEMHFTLLKMSAIGGYSLSCSLATRSSRSSGGKWKTYDILVALSLDQSEINRRIFYRRGIKKVLILDIF